MSTSPISTAPWKEKQQGKVQRKPHLGPVFVLLQSYGRKL